MLFNQNVQFIKHLLPGARLPISVAHGGNIRAFEQPGKSSNIIVACFFKKIMHHLLRFDEIRHYFTWSIPQWRSAGGTIMRIFNNRLPLSTASNTIFHNISLRVFSFYVYVYILTFARNQDVFINLNIILSLCQVLWIRSDI